MTLRVQVHSKNKQGAWASLPAAESNTVSCRINPGLLVRGARLPRRRQGNLSTPFDALSCSRMLMQHSLHQYFSQPFLPVQGRRSTPYAKTSWIGFSPLSTTRMGLPELVMNVFE
jgi:hypothetical protein